MQIFLAQLEIYKYNYIYKTKRRLKVEYQSKFKEFLAQVEQREFTINQTATGASIIQQSQRNALRKEGVAAFLADLLK